MTRKAKRMLAIVQSAEVLVHEAYLSLCDETGEAFDPAHDLGLPGWACDLLSEAYEARLRRETD
jgi:hypothetical protein